MKTRFACIISPRFRYSPEFILPKSQARLLRAGMSALSREFSNFSNFVRQAVSLSWMNRLTACSTRAS
jgi:hypothetical protein